MCLLAYGIPFFFGCGESYFPEILDTQGCNECIIFEDSGTEFEDIVELLSMQIFGIFILYIIFSPLLEYPNVDFIHPSCCQNCGVTSENF